MAQTDVELSLNDYLDIVARRKVIIGLLTIVGLLTAIALSYLATPQYRAQARVRVDASNSASLVDNATNVSGQVRDRNLQNEVEFARSDRVSSATAGVLGNEVVANVAASSDSDSLIFTVESDSPAEAAVGANAFADAYVSERSLASGERFIAAVDIINERLASISQSRLELETALETTSDPSSTQIQLDSLAAEEAGLRAQLNEIDLLSQLNNSASVALLNAAESPTAPFSPSWPRNIALGLITGALLGIGAGLIRETLDDTILSKQGLEAASDGVSVLGLIPPPNKSGLRGRSQRRLITTRTGTFVESFRSLRSAIELGLASGTDIRSILVTSANPAEGKSTVASHLAIAFARSGARVLVIDTDMHNPTQHELFGIPNRDGLADELANLGNAEISIEQASGEGLLSVIPAGVSGSSPAELLRSTETSDFIEKLTGAYDIVIIDSPPLLPVADTLPIARIADATLLVSMRGQTNTADLEHAMELLARAQVRPFGTVLCGVENNDSGYGYGARRKNG